MSRTVLDMSTQLINETLAVLSVHTERNDMVSFFPLDPALIHPLFSYIEEHSMPIPELLYNRYAMNNVAGKTYCVYRRHKDVVLDLLLVSPCETGTL